MNQLIFQHRLIKNCTRFNKVLPIFKIYQEHPTMNPLNGCRGRSDQPWTNPRPTLDQP